VTMALIAVHRDFALVATETIHRYDSAPAPVYMTRSKLIDLAGARGRISGFAVGGGISNLREPIDLAVSSARCQDANSTARVIRSVVKDAPTRYARAETKIFMVRAVGDGALTGAAFDAGGALLDQTTGGDDIWASFLLPAQSNMRNVRALSDIHNRLLVDLSFGAYADPAALVSLFARRLRETASVSADVSGTVEVGLLAREQCGVAAYRLSEPAAALERATPADVMAGFAGACRPRVVVLSAPRFVDEHPSVLNRARWRYRGAVLRAVSYGARLCGERGALMHVRLYWLLMRRWSYPSLLSGSFWRRVAGRVNDLLPFEVRRKRATPIPLTHTIAGFNTTKASDATVHSRRPSPHETGRS
jgi:hypothetical protein